MHNKREKCLVIPRADMYDGDPASMPPPLRPHTQHLQSNIKAAFLCRCHSLALLLQSQPSVRKQFKPSTAIQQHVRSTLFTCLPSRRPWFRDWWLRSEVHCRSRFRVRLRPQRKIGSSRPLSSRHWNPLDPQKYQRSLLFSICPRRSGFRHWRL